MKKRFLIAAFFALFLGGIAVAQSQEQASTLTELQAEKEKLEAKLAKVIEEKENAENSLVGKYKDVMFAFNKHISKKQKKFTKIVLRGAKRKEKRIKKELKRLHKRIEKIRELEKSPLVASGDFLCLFGGRIGYYINTDAVRVYNGKMAVAPRLFAKLYGNRYSLLF